jgi:hypothetical protein
VSAPHVAVFSEDGALFASVEKRIAAEATVTRFDGCGDCESRSGLFARTDLVLIDSRDERPPDRLRFLEGLLPQLCRYAQLVVLLNERSHRRSDLAPKASRSRFDIVLHDGEPVGCYVRAVLHERHFPQVLIDAMRAQRPYLSSLGNEVAREILSSAFAPRTISALAAAMHQHRATLHHNLQASKDPSAKRIRDWCIALAVAGLVRRTNWPLTTLAAFVGVADCETVRAVLMRRLGMGVRRIRQVSRRSCETDYLAWGVSRYPAPPPAD